MRGGDSSEEVSVRTRVTSTVRRTTGLETTTKKNTESIWRLVL